MTIAVTTEAAPSRHRWLCFFLAVIATIELVDALTSIQTIFTDHPDDTTALRFAQTLTNIRLLLTPLIVAAALVFCAMGNVHRAILALAAFDLMVWSLDGVPAIALHGLTTGVLLQDPNELGSQFRERCSSVPAAFTDAAKAQVDIAAPLYLDELDRAVWHGDPAERVDAIRRLHVALGN